MSVALDEFTAKVVGLTFQPGYPGSLYALEQEVGLRDVHGDETPVLVDLVRDPHNEHDPNCVDVIGPDGILGHLPKALSGKIAGRMDGGEIWFAWVEKVLISEEHGGNPGLEIRVAAL